MISKKTFVDSINQIVKYAEMNDRVTSIYRENNVEYFPGQYFEYEGMVVRLLSEVMNDKDDWIGWWLYDCNYGRDTEGRASYKDDSPIIVDTPEKLYDFLYNKYICDSEDNAN